MGKLKPENPINLMVKNNGFRLRFSQQNHSIEIQLNLIIQVGNLANGAYGSGNSLSVLASDFFATERFFGDFRGRTEELSKKSLGIYVISVKQ